MVFLHPFPFDASFWGPTWRALAADVQVLTPEYQRRFAQVLYHVGVSNSAQWVSSTCYPEGMIRWWAQGIRDIQLTITPYQVQMLSGTASDWRGRRVTV